MKIIHLTDPHLVPKGNSLRGIDPEARLRACLSDIATHHSDAIALVISGDIADLADLASYELFRDVVAGFVLPPIYMTVGNHDRRSVFGAVFPEHLAEDGYAHSRFELGGYVGLLLDTLTIGTHGGALDAARISWLKAQLSDGDRPVLIFMHHPPVRVGLKRLDHIALQGEDAFWETLAPFRERIRHIFYGHVHRNIAGSWRGIPFAGSAGLAHQVVLDFETELVRHAEVEPGYTVILANGRDIIVHPHTIRDTKIIDIVPDTTPPPSAT